MEMERWRETHSVGVNDRELLGGRTFDRTVKKDGKSAVQLYSLKNIWYHRIEGELEGMGESLGKFETS